MITRKSIIRLFALTVFFSCAGPLFAQATFTVSSSSPTGADIGVAELAGQVVLTVNSGTTVDSAFLIQYSAPITNASAAEISVVGTGGLMGIASAPALDRTNSALTIIVPAGAAAPSQIRITGVRVALAGLNRTNVTATVSATGSGGNTVVAGQGTVEVISSIKQPFVFQYDPNQIALSNLSAMSATATITIAENYPEAFSSAVGVAGRTVPTMIRFNPFPSIPQGVTLTFAATATSAETGATFQTASGAAETVPRSDGTTSVVYRFSGVGNSDSTIETFGFAVTVTVQPPAGTGSLAFQATLLPIGIAVPDSDFPSTDVPRYVERQVPDETDLQSGTVTLAFPFRSQSDTGAYTGIALTNPIPFRVKLSLSAYDAGGRLISGPGITNPVDVTMPRGGQIAKLASEIFGAGFNASGAGTIIATAKASTLPGFYLEGGGNQSGNGLDGAVADLTPMGHWVWPTVFHQGPSPYTTLQIYNPGATPATATLTLFDSAGALIATATATVQPGGTRIQDLRAFFSGLDPQTVTGGFVRGTSDVGLAVTENFGNDLDSNVLPGQIATQKSSYLVPHFVSGGGYSTELSVVNVDASMTAHLTLTAIDNSGAVMGGGPTNLSIPPGTQQIQTLDQLFPSLGNSLTTGYLRIDVETSHLGPFETVPAIAGSIRFTSAGGSGSTALPLFVASASDFVYSHVAQNAGYFTGVALINPNPVAVTAGLEVFAADGVSVGTASIPLQPGAKIAKLLFELIPATAGQNGGFVRIRSALPLVSFSLFGTNDGRSLSAIPPQKVN
jgi:hypothetical protein